MRACIITSAPMPPEEGMGYYVYNLAQHLTRKWYLRCRETYPLSDKHEEGFDAQVVAALTTIGGKVIHCPLIERSS